MTTSSAEELFETVTSKVKSSTALPLSESLKLKLYGFYKRSTVGSTTESGEPVPSMFSIIARKKYNAWAACDDVEKEDSMLNYVRIVADIDCDLGREVREMLDEFERGGM